MHIAKAGGSTVNDYLLGRYPPGRVQTHIESTPLWRDDPQGLHEYDCLSGHVDLRTLDRRLGLDGYHLVTVMRSPWRQLVSHLAWIRRLAEPGEAARLAKHPPVIRSLAEKLGVCDFRDPKSIAQFRTALSPAERPLLDNCQVRYFAATENPWVTEEDRARALAALGRFDRIGTVERLGDFLRGLADDMGWPAPDVPQRKNVTPGFYGLEDALPAVREALQPFVCHDEVLYGAVAPRESAWKRWLMPWRSAGRKG